ncbi:hypothetical protein N9E03_00120 [bacterium]|nr:hypothetical protein [bacterium]|tara:strand:- start:115 stop:369 length:255 start_codon:yes stop_codon:yes gene_type:complete
MVILGHDIQTKIDKIVEWDKRHGGPYDRGGADSYYRRGCKPHYYVDGTHNSNRIEECDMTDAEIRAYEAGYLDNENDGDFKDWG